MSHPSLASRLLSASAPILAAIAILLGAGGAAAQEVPADLTVVPPVRTDFVPQKTPWGDPDLRGIWPTQAIVDAGVPLERPPESGNRAWLTEAEFAERLDAAERSDAGVGREGNLNASTDGLAKWVRTSPDGRRSSMLVSPADGRLPPLTPAAEALTRDGKSSWKSGQAIDSVYDLDAFDRCITRGLPSIMLPTMLNNAARIFQAPGLVVLKMETLDTRIIPLGGGDHRPAAVRTWMGDSRGHWDGNTLVIETTNIIDGDGTGRDPGRLAASPAYGVSPFPVSRQALVVERLTMTAHDRIEYEVTYRDPEVFTSPWSARLEWSRDDGYRLFEYACHEGNVQIRDMINSSRAQRRTDAEAISAGKGG